MRLAFKSCAPPARPRTRVSDILTVHRSVRTRRTSSICAPSLRRAAATEAEIRGGIEFAATRGRGKRNLCPRFGALSRSTPQPRPRLRSLVTRTAWRSARRSRFSLNRATAPNAETQVRLGCTGRTLPIRNRARASHDQKPEDVGTSPWSGTMSPGRHPTRPPPVAVKELCEQGHTVPLRMEPEAVPDRARQRLVARAVAAFPMTRSSRRCRPGCPSRPPGK